MDKQLYSLLQCKREKMHEIYEINRNLRDEKVLEVSVEIDGIINKIMQTKQSSTDHK
ncbi:MAG TPA: hypothetical protein DDY49_03390 [Paenibacillaceae bacterium]|nr:hypothetical protein [Paenibacillaceae bacterium]